MENNITVAEISDVADKTGNGFSDKKHEKTKTDWNKIGFLFSMFIIPCLNFLIFYVYVNFDSVLLSFQKRDGSFTLENFAWVFKELASEDSVLKEAFINTITFFLNEYIVVRIVTLIMAYFFYKKIMGYGFFRVLFYVPNILSAVVMVSIYDGFIGPSGPLYQFLEQQTGVQYEFLFDSRYAMKALLIYQIWLAFGTGTIMLTSAMGRIPEEVTEAAILDGVSPWKEFTKIIFPLIWPTLSTLMITGLAGLLSADCNVLLFTQGKYGTYTISYWMYEQVVTYQSLWHASAFGQLCTLILIPIVFIGKYILERFGSDVTY